MTDSTKQRKPYPRVRKPRKTVFTPAIWAHWLTPPPKETTLRLRAGIAEFRQSLGFISDTKARS
jgi:hypothetical protein